MSNDLGLKLGSSTVTSGRSDLTPPSLTYLIFKAVTMRVTIDRGSEDSWCMASTQGLLTIIIFIPDNSCISLLEGRCECLSHTQHDGGRDHDSGDHSCIV